jgi:Icc-related predicted phosphoesterase
VTFRYDAICVSVNIQVFGRPDESKRRAFCGIKVKVEKNLEKEISRDAIATRLTRRTVPIAAKASNWDLKYISQINETLRLTIESTVSFPRR